MFERVLASVLLMSGHPALHLYIIDAVETCPALVVDVLTRGFLQDKIHGQQVETLENHGHQLEQRMVQLLALCSSQQETIKHVEARNKDLQVWPRAH